MSKNFFLVLRELDKALKSLALCGGGDCKCLCGCACCGCVRVSVCLSFCLFVCVSVCCVRVRVVFTSISQLEKITQKEGAGENVGCPHLAQR